MPSFIGGMPALRTPHHASPGLSGVIGRNVGTGAARLPTITPQQAHRHALKRIERPRSVVAAVKWPRGVAFALQTHTWRPLDGGAC